MTSSTCSREISLSHGTAKPSAGCRPTRMTSPLLILCRRCFLCSREIATSSNTLGPFGTSPVFGKNICGVWDSPQVIRFLHKTAKEHEFRAVVKLEADRYRQTWQLQQSVPVGFPQCWSTIAKHDSGQASISWTTSLFSGTSGTGRLLRSRNSV